MENDELEARFDCQAFIDRMGWTQYELAERLGCSQPTVSQWCSGKNFPPFPVLVKLVSIGAGITDLFGEKVASRMLENDRGAGRDGCAFDSEIERVVLKVLHERGIL